jgi:hypothetical protein
MIQVQSLSQINGLEEITLRAGHQGIDNVIRWPYVAENNDIGDWIYGGELIFITGLNWQWQSEDFKYLIHLAKTKRASGLVILTKSPYITVIPDDVLAFADKEGLPVFEQPYSLPMVTVTELLSNAIIKSDLAYQSIRWLMGYLLESREPTEMTITKAAEFGIDTAHCFSIAVVVPELQQKGELARYPFLLNQFLADNKSVFPLLEYHQGWLLSLPSTLEEGTNIIDKWQYLLDQLTTQNFKCNIGISTGKGLTQFHSTAFQARQSVDFAIYQEGSYVVHYRDLGINQLFSTIEDYRQLTIFCQKHLGALYHCFKPQTNLLKTTLRCYFEHLGSARKTALTLNIHRNTLTNRLNKIEKLTGLHLSNAQERLCLQNALVMEKLIITKQHQY